MALKETAVTIKDVAKHANVTKSTVSRVLNNSLLVSEKTKAQVLASIQTLGYIPNKAARTLKSGKNHIIGLVVNFQQFSDVILNPYFPMLLKAITEKAQTYGYNILLITTAGVDFQSYADVIRKHTADGFIIIGATFNNTLSEKLDKAGIPYVFTMKYSLSQEASYVNFNHAYGGYMAAKYVIELGHRDIKLIIGDAAGNILSHNVDRINGFRQALEEFGLPYDEEMVLKTPPDMDSSYHFIQSLYQSQSPTALLISNEVTSIAALNALMDQGYAIPDDISLVAFGHSDFFKNIRPSLTTVHHDFEWSGRQLVDMLLKRINGEDNQPAPIIKQPQLMLGHSTARPKSMLKKDSTGF